MSYLEKYSIYELHFLIGAFDATLLPGLPSLKELYPITEQTWKFAKESLEEKKLVQQDGALTEEGFIVVELLREYCTGRELTIINNYYFMLSQDSHFSVLIVDTEEGYQLAKLDRMARLKLLHERVSLVSREPKEDETEFLTKELSIDNAIEESFISDESISVQHYPLKKMVDRRHPEELMESCLFVEKDNELIGFDIKREELFRYSQYYFLERLYSWLDIPFREEDFDDNL